MATSSPINSALDGLNPDSSNIKKLQQLVCFQREQILSLNRKLLIQNQQLLFLFSQNKNLQIQQDKTSKYDNILLKDMVDEFISSFSSHKTQKTYSEGFVQLFEQGFLDSYMRLKDFRSINGEWLLDNVRKSYKGRKRRSGQISEASESTKQLRAAMLISFSTFLQRRTEGFIQKIAPNKFGFDKTFRFRREKTAASRLSDIQISSFLSCLQTFSKTAFLIASLQLIGAKRISEVLNLQVEDLDLAEKRIFFKTLKSRGIVRDAIAIYLPTGLCEELKQYVMHRQKGFVFSNPKDENSSLPLTKEYVSKLYHRGWNLLHKTSDKLKRKEDFKDEDKISPFRPRMITHSLRAAGISYLYEKGIDSQLIKQITGHSSGDMVRYYNTASSLNNITQSVHIFDLQ